MKPDTNLYMGLCLQEVFLKVKILQFTHSYIQTSDLHWDFLTPAFKVKTIIVAQFFEVFFI